MKQKPNPHPKSQKPKKMKMIVTSMRRKPLKNRRDPLRCGTTRKMLSRKELP
jgi:hypothetical protein